jgi:DNA-binding PadR family transcriptional regulator
MMENDKFEFGRHGFGRHFGGDRGGPHGGPFGGPHGGGRRRIFDSSELQLVLLKLIADQPRHGYDLIRAIEELTGGGYAPSPGVVYPALSMLQDISHIEETKSEGARKAFAVTAEGTQELTTNADKVTALFERLAAMAKMQDRTDGAPIRRAMENLRTALRGRLASDSATKDTVHDVAAILDEAAQRIERLP